MKKVLLITLISSTLIAQVMPIEDKTVTRVLPDEPGFKNDTEYKKKYEEIKSQIDALKKDEASAQAKLLEGQKAKRNWVLGF
jgi:hypothetical protein